MAEALETNRKPSLHEAKSNKDFSGHANTGQNKIEPVVKEIFSYCDQKLPNEELESGPSDFLHTPKAKKQANSKQKCLKKTNTFSHTIVNLDQTTNATKKYLVEYPFKSIKHTSEKIILPGLILKFFIVLLNTFLIIPLSIYLSIALLLSYIFRLTFKLFHICHLTSASKYQESVPEFLKPIELFWLLSSNLIDTPMFKSRCSATGTCILYIEGPISKPNLKNLVKNRILSSEQRANQRSLARFRQRLYNLWAYGYVWLDCDEAAFDLDDHISEIKDPNNVLWTENNLQEHISGLISNHQFDIEKPLWKIYIKSNFIIPSDDQNTISTKGTVLIFLSHMCFADGVSLIRVLFKTLADNRNAVDIKPRFANSRFRIEVVQQFFFNLYRVFTCLICKRPDKNPLHSDSYKKRIFKSLNESSNSTFAYRDNPQTSCGQNINIQSKKRRDVIWSAPFSTVAINRLKVITRMKLNDFLLSLVSGILREYLQKKGINNPQDMHCILPINLSCNKYPSKLVNNTTMASMSIPANTEGAVPNLWMTRASTSKLKNSGDLFFIYFFMFIMFKSLPNRFATYLTSCLINKNTLLATSLGSGDASLSTITLCNQDVRDIILIHPTFCKIGISFTFMNYGEGLRLAIMSNPELFKNPEFIVNEFNKKLDVINKLLSGRRVPGEIRRPVRNSAVVQTSRTTKICTSTTNHEVQNIHEKLNKIYKEIQLLSEYCDELDPNSVDYNNLKQLATIKQEKFKIKFSHILASLQERQLNNKYISSDEEEELNPVDRGRLRSASTGSRISSRSSSASRKPR